MNPVRNELADNQLKAPSHIPNLPSPICHLQFYLRKQILAYIFASTYLHNMETRRDVFHAIADPTRRQIIGLLAGGPMNLNAIAGEFDMTRQAVSLHVKVLTECGLLVIKQQGRERFCEARLDRLHEVVSWAEQYRKHWTGRFLALEKHLQETATVKNKKYGRKKH